MLPRYERWGVHDSCRHVQTRIDASNVAILRGIRQVHGVDLPVTITGDINIHFQTVDETNTKRMNEILESFGLVQHVSEATHECGGILDVVITSIDQRPFPSTTSVYPTTCSSPGRSSTLNRPQCM